MKANIEVTILPGALENSNKNKIRTLVLRQVTLGVVAQW